MSAMVGIAGKPAPVNGFGLMSEYKSFSGIHPNSDMSLQDTVSQERSFPMHKLFQSSKVLCLTAQTFGQAPSSTVHPKRIASIS